MTDQEQGGKEMSEEQIARIVDIANKQIAMLVNELKGVFIPSWKITFIARNPEEASQYTLITEECDKATLIKAIEKFKEPKAIQTTQQGNV